MKIPKIIHQAWKTLDVPVELAHPFHSWKTHHPDWHAAGWSDELLGNFAAKEYPQYLDLLNSYALDINRVNLLRYLILKKYGGVFVDLDLECLKPIDLLLGDHSLIVGREPDSHAGHPVAKERQMPKVVGTAFIASVPGHPFWDHLLRLVPHFAGEQDPLVATGSIFLTTAIATYPQNATISVAAPTLLYPFDRTQIWSGMASNAAIRQQATAQSFTLHFWLGTWRDRRPQPIPGDAKAIA